jgi:oligogalacturonide lyase
MMNRPRRTLLHSGVWLLALWPTLAAGLLGQVSPAPFTWIDPATGHRVIRLTDEPGTASLYFNDHGYTPDGKEMIYTTADGSVGVLTLSSLGAVAQRGKIEHRIMVQGPVATIAVGHRTPTVFYTKAGADPLHGTLWSTNLATGATQKLADLPRRGRIVTINADETLAAGMYIEGDGADYGGPATIQAHPLDQAPNKTQLMAERLARRLPMWIYTVDLKTGQPHNLLFGRDWLNHLQFSPADPTLLMYCHEGEWQQVDRIWTIRTDGSQNRLMHHRTMQMEIAGHEWWGADGKTVWYQLDFPRFAPNAGMIASLNVETGERVWYHDEPNTGSIHANTSPDGTLFCGDGDKRSPWIYLFHPHLVPDDRTLGTDLIKGGYVTSERLVNMQKHDYKLEPNPSFTPDQKYIVFRANWFGANYAYAVEVAKSSPTPTP